MKISYRTPCWVFGLFWLFTLPLSNVNAAGHAVIDRLEASVNATLIFKSDILLFKKIEKLRSQLDPLYSGTPISTKGANATDSEIIEFLINEKLISQLFPVSEAEVEQEVNSIQANNHIDRGALKAALLQQGFLFEDYFELIRSSTSKRNLIDHDIRTKVSITDSDVKNYFYNNYTKATGTIRTYKLKIISVSAKSYKTPAAVKEAIAQAQKALREGESFEEVAKRSSDDASASAGGDLGSLTEDQVSPVIREQLKKLRIGQVSEVFGSPTSSLYILKLEDVSSDESGRLEKVKDEIRNQLMATEYQHQISLWLERQRQKAFIHKAGEPSVTSLPSQP